MPSPVSAHQLKTWSQCKKKYFYEYVQKLRWPTDPSNFKLGRTVHKLLDYQSRGLAFDHLLNDTEPNIQSSWTLLKNAPITHLSILGNEWPFMVKVADFWLGGRIDRIAQYQNEVWVIDWKTGTGVPRLPETDWQTLLYRYAVVESATDLGLPALHPEQVSFVFVEVKEQIREIKIPYSQAEHTKTNELLHQTLTLMDQETNYNLPHHCPDRYCPYQSICGINDAANN